MTGGSLKIILSGTGPVHCERSSDGRKFLNRWQLAKEGIFINGHLEPDGGKFRSSLAAGKKRGSSSNGHLEHNGGKFRNF